MVVGLVCALVGSGDLFLRVRGGEPRPWSPLGLVLGGLGVFSLGMSLFRQRDREIEG